MHGSFQGVNTTLQGIQTSMNKLLYYAEKGVTCTCQRENPDIQRQERKPYKLGQDIFYQHHQFTIENTSRSSPLQKAVITNDGHVAFIQGSSSIEIYNTDGSHVGTIPLQSLPFDITVVNNSTVAVTQPLCNSIDIWDINNQQRVKSIQLSTPCCIGITTINNKLVVGCKRRLLIIDPQTEKVEKTINTGGDTPFRLCGSGDGIFYTCFDSYYLHHYSHSNNKI
ncbi:uncharacterized protein LOC127734608 isoform X7 [Mytilus californianus]|nr:uncharacterized protein LOC127734608 isoform X7 [Mytilus californianus]XP_052100541.1 uncharacterized protein LOC127734608 isoform X7 [Mytilus californianus]